MLSKRNSNTLFHIFYLTLRDKKNRDERHLICLPAMEWLHIHITLCNTVKSFLVADDNTFCIKLCINEKMKKTVNILNGKFVQNDFQIIVLQWRFSEFWSFIEVKFIKNSLILCLLDDESHELKIWLSARMDEIDTHAMHHCSNMYFKHRNRMCQENTIRTIHLPNTKDMSAQCQHIMWPSRTLTSELVGQKLEHQ